MTSSWDLMENKSGNETRMGKSTWPGENSLSEVRDFQLETKRLFISVTTSFALINVEAEEIFDNNICFSVDKGSVQA